MGGKFIMWYAVIFVIMIGTPDAGFMVNPFPFWSEIECLNDMNAIELPKEFEVHGTCIYVDNVQGI
jgi:hypothetical protein